jgi:hypothetical protein
MRVCAPAVPAAAALAAAPAAAPVRPGREEARGWALDELAKREYADARPGLVERAFSWVFERLARIGDASDEVSLLLLGILTLVIGTIVVWGIWRAGGLGRTARRRDGAVLGDPTVSAAEHRAAADSAAAQERWDDAVLHRFRAVARQLEEEAILSPQPGRTADEVAHESGRRLPDLAADLLAGARTFDDVCYGHRHVGRAADERMRALDDAVRRARPVANGGATGPRLTVPS